MGVSRILYAFGIPDGDSVQKLNRKQLAAVFEISLPTVDDWVRRGCPGAKGNIAQPYQFSLPEVVKWRVRELLKREPRPTVKRDADAGTLAETELRKLTAEAELKELELAKRREQLVNADTARLLWRHMLKEFSVIVKALPMKRAREFADENDWSKILEVFDADCRDCLTVLSKFDPAGLGPTGAMVDGGDTDTSSSAPEHDDEPVGRRAPRDQRGKKQRAGTVAHRPHAVSP